MAPKVSAHADNPKYMARQPVVDLDEAKSTAIDFARASYQNSLYLIDSFGEMRRDLGVGSKTMAVHDEDIAQIKRDVAELKSAEAARIAAAAAVEKALAPSKQRFTAMQTAAIGVFMGGAGILLMWLVLDAANRHINMPANTATTYTAPAVAKQP